ncbi:DVU3141 family protein [Salinicola avicenniae]|uniref:DVU3141 family protein n=1 Tax=Salinicola avicenniae TaxID=2916836 RepID=UPI002074752D|nr:MULTISPECIES: DVU3141 family protein [unclassified Salinicola]
MSKSNNASQRLGRAGGSSQWIALTLVVASMSGCAGGYHPAQTSNGMVPMDNATPAGAPLNAFLDNAVVGSVATLPQSPWGANVSVHARERYFSASGRQCLHLDVTRNTAPASLGNGEVACLVPGQGWYSQRLVTDIIR